MMVFGVNFAATASKTDFHRMLETKISITLEDADTQPTCIGVCTDNQNH